MIAAPIPLVALAPLLAVVLLGCATTVAPTPAPKGLEPGAATAPAATPNSPKEKPPMSASALPIVADKSGIAEHAGDRVRLVGRYTQLDVRMKPSPPPLYRGHVLIALDDRTGVLLEPEWRDEAIRPPDERRRLDGRRVEVVGMILPRAPRHPEGANSLAMPCLTDIESIAEAK